MENGPPTCMLSGGWETGNLFGVVLWLHTNACNVKQRHFVIIALEPYRWSSCCVSMATLSEHI